MSTALGTAPPPPPPPPARRRRELRREPGVVGGVCAGLGTRLGVDPIVLRVLVLVGCAAGGVGLVLYLLAWAVMPGGGRGAARTARVRARSRGAAEVAAGIGLLVLATLLLFRAWGLWVGDAVAWPLVLVSVGAAVLWRQLTAPGPDADAAAPPADDPGAPAPPAPAQTDVGQRERRDVAAVGPISGDARRRALLGAALVVGGALVFLELNGVLSAARDVLLTALVVLVAVALLLAPWWTRLWRAVGAERAERIRAQERAEVAAHLHDSVLQTLALMQTRAEDPRAVAQLARRQERELRAWLDGGRPDDRPATLAAALRAAAAAVEDAHGVSVDVVAVGDRALDDDTEALVAATREALVNAARHAGADQPVSVYLEAGADRVEVFVRDRGAGFDPARVPADRRGVRESIVGRMARHGGRATVHSAPGAGTEVELVLESRS